MAELDKTNIQSKYSCLLGLMNNMTTPTVSFNAMRADQFSPESCRQRAACRLQLAGISLAGALET